MANADAPFGFRPINADGGPYNGVTRRCVLATGDGTATFIGDAVKIAGTSIDGYPTIAQVAAGDPVLGVVTSFEANPDSLSDQYRKASTQRFCQVALADNAFFEVQESGTAIGLASVGLNANIVVTAGSTVTGLSKMELDSDTEAATSTLDLQIFGGVHREDNDLTLANACWIVKFNDPQGKPLRTGT
jgi:hypothetical protein